MKTKSSYTKYKDPYSYTGFLIWIIGNILSQDIEDSETKNHKVIFSHFMVLASLFWLLETKKKVNQRNLAMYTHLREITISTIIKKLHIQKYVSVITDNSDKRSKIITITEKGLRFLIETLDSINQKEKRLKKKELSGLAEKLTFLLQELSGKHI